MRAPKEGGNVKRKTMMRGIILAAIMMLATIGMMAQNAELAITAGGNFPNDNYVNADKSPVFGVSFAGRWLHGPGMGLYVELPLVVATKSGFTEPNSLVRNGYRSLFFTPGLKLKFLGSMPISPYVLAGAGVAHFSTENDPVAGNSSSNKAVFDVGGGVDMKVAPYISLRGELRDFISGTPNLAAIRDSGHQHSVVLQGGVVFRF